MSIHSIDINCDLGESIDPEIWLYDSKIMPYISSCNIACGGHAGNQLSMDTSIKNALENQLNIGAHPSFPDKKNFGRQVMKMTHNEIRKSIRQQLQKFEQICHANNTAIHHIKPHGALYNLAAIDLQIALIIAEESAGISTDLILVGLANSLMKESAESAGIKFWSEGFMDRCYHNTGLLLSRENDLAIHGNIEHSIKQALALASGHAVETFEGEPLKLSVDTICLHGDHDNSLALASKLYNALQQQNIVIN